MSTNAWTQEELDEIKARGHARWAEAIYVPALEDVAEAAKALWVPDPNKVGIGFKRLGDALRDLKVVAAGANPQVCSEDEL